MKNLISILKTANHVGETPYSMDMLFKIFNLERELFFDVTKPYVDPEYEIVIKAFKAGGDFNNYFSVYEGIEVDGANIIWTEYEKDEEIALYHGLEHGTYQNETINLTKVTISLDAFPTSVRFKRSDDRKYSLIYSVEKMCNMSNITSMESMFDECPEFKYIRDPNFDTSNVTNMKRIFFGCHYLTDLDVTGWDTSKVTTMHDMFGWCINLTSKDNLIGFDDLDFSSVIDMSRMFNACRELTSFKFNNWNTSSLENIEEMFHDCRKMVSVDMNSLDTSKVKTMECMFYWCKKLKNIYCGELDMSSLENAHEAFYELPIEEIDMLNWNAKNIKDTSYMFYDCANLKTVKLFDLNNSTLENPSHMFDGCTALTTLEGNLTNLVLNDVWSFEYTFAGLNLKEIDLSGLYAPKVRHIEGMFGGGKYETIKLANVQMYPVTNDEGYIIFDRLFSNCVNLKNLDLTNCFLKFVQGYTTNPNYPGYVFYNCHELVWDDIIFGDYHEYHKSILKWYYDNSINL
jgi:surface protein